MWEPVKISTFVEMTAWRYRLIIDTQLCHPAKVGIYSVGLIHWHWTEVSGSILEIILVLMYYNIDSTKVEFPKGGAFACFYNPDLF